MRDNSEVIFSLTTCNRVMEWHEYLLLTKRKNGTFTLKMRSAGEGRIDHDYCSKPFRSGYDFCLALTSATLAKWDEYLGRRTSHDVAAWHRETRPRT